MLRMLLVGLGVLGSLSVSADCVRVTGDLTQGAWLRFEGDSIKHFDWNEQPLTVLDGRLSWVGLSREAPLENQLRVQFDSGKVCLQSVILLQQTYDVSVIEGVPQRTVTPPKEDLDRIRKERAQVTAAKATVYECVECIEELLFATQMPLTGRISGVYGSQRVYNGVPGNPHYGLDIARPTGTAVNAPSRGLVVLAEPDLYYSGGTVILHHGFGVSSSFLHMSRLHVQEGDIVEQGALIGEVGATGRATGPHLDWRMNHESSRVDPNTLFRLVSEP